MKSDIFKTGEWKELVSVIRDIASTEPERSEAYKTIQTALRSTYHFLTRRWWTEYVAAGETASAYLDYLLYICITKMRLDGNLKSYFIRTVDSYCIKLLKKRARLSTHYSAEVSVGLNQIIEELGGSYESEQFPLVFLKIIYERLTARQKKVFTHRMMGFDLKEIREELCLLRSELDRSIKSIREVAMDEMEVCDVG